MISILDQEEVKTTYLQKFKEKGDHFSKEVVSFTTNT